MEIVKKKIAGVNCVFARMPGSLSVTVQLFAKAGSIFETRETNGLSHFLEHLFFKGGKRYPTPKSVAEAVAKFGGAMNAWTYELGTAYYIKSAPQFIEKSLDVLGDMIVNAQFPADELEREKWVVIQEIKMIEDDPRRKIWDLWEGYFWGDNPRGRSVIGTEENVRSFTPEMVAAHRDALYTKDNTVLMITGDWPEGTDFENLVGEFFGAMPERCGLDPAPFPNFVPSERQKKFEKKTEQNHLIFSANGFTGTQDERHAAEIVANLLGGGMNSRLFQNIREKQGLCYYIGADHSDRPQTGRFNIFAGIDKGNFEFGLEKIREEIAEVAAGNFTEQEFEDSKSEIIGGAPVALETSNRMGRFLGESELFYGKIETLEKELEKTRAVTFEDAKNAAKKLAAENLTLCRIE